ncbi:MAG: hypothetical protein N2C14_18405 [Planctomycetales bacterium]
MNYESRFPDAADQMLARLGGHVEYSDRDPNGLVNLTRSKVADEDLRDLVFYPGFDALNLDKTLISDVGLKFIGGMSNLEGLQLYDTVISDHGLKELLGLSRLERLDIACDPG